jgi:protein-L-isoaspartate(D-aspartate) O-methyltransferase
VRSLLVKGVLTDAWAGAFRAVPRARFLPERMWVWDMAGGGATAVDRGDDPEGWTRAAYADVPLVTQWDDGRQDGDGPGKVPTSSASMPSVVAGMLRDADIGPGLRVLEVGTGTGWNAGLLAHRLGGGQVVSVEIDEAVAGRAREALRRQGLDPAVVCGDGRDGWAGGAPYDRVVVTAGVRDVPAAWLAQTRPGGTVLAPWGTHYSDQDALVRLTVGADGGAEGPFLRMVEFMKLRGQRLDWGRFRDHVGEFPGDAETSRTDVPLADLGGRYQAARFVAGLYVPDCAHVVNPMHDGTTRAWFFDLRGRSWAAVRFPDGTVWQDGPRRLWDEVEAALSWWDGRGRPGVGRFGLRVGPDGRVRPLLDGRPVR